MKGGVSETLQEAMGRLKERIYILLSLLVMVFAIVQTWLFMNKVYTIEQFIMSTLSMAILFIGLVGGLNKALVSTLVSIFVYGFLKVYLYVKSNQELVIGVSQFLWLLVLPTTAYIGGLLKREQSKLIERYTRLAENFEQLVTVDEIVGLEKSERFASRASEEISRVKRYGGTFSILLVKVDLLKELFVIYGDSVKNLALRKIADVMMKNKREEDFLAYLGEGEYALLLPNTGKDGAETLKKRVKQNLKALDISLKEGVSKRIKINVKIGTASYPDDGEDYFILIAEARKGYEYDLS